MSEIVIIAAEALWFFLPAFVANQCPGFAAALDLPGNVPVSRKYLGENKTFAAYYAGPIGAVSAFYLQQKCQSVNVHYGWYVAENITEVLLIGVLFGLGAVVGDHVKSFFKRRIGIPPGNPWFPFDQVDFVIGALVFIWPIAGWRDWKQILALVVIAIVFHPVVNCIGFRLGLRKTWR